MAYATGTITSATPAKDLMTALGTQLVAAGLTLVDTVNTFTTVYKSPAAGNQQNADWFLILKRNTDAALQVFYQVAEAYDPALHLASKYGGQGLSVMPVAGTGGVNPSAPAAPDTICAVNANLALTTTAFTYWVSVTANRLILGVKTSVEIGFYAGLYDDRLSVGTVTFPLVCAKLPINQLFTWAIASSSTNAAGGFTRDPLQSVLSTNSFEATVHNGFWTNPINAVVPGNFTPMATAAALYGNPGTLSRAMIGSGRTFGNSNPAGDALRGLLIGCWTSAISSAAGDTTTTGGKTYTRVQGPATTFGFFVDQAL